MATGFTPKSIKSAASGLGTYNGLLLAAIVHICALPKHMEKEDGHKSEATYALVVAILTCFAILVFEAYESNTMDRARFPFFALFTILWLVSASLTTFRGPFLETGNGYFSAW